MTIHNTLTGTTTVILGGGGNVGEGLARAHLRAGATVIVPGGDKQ